jgi:hypothetical protein
MRKAHEPPFRAYRAGGGRGDWEALCVCVCVCVLCVCVCVYVCWLAGWECYAQTLTRCAEFAVAPPMAALVFRGALWGAFQRLTVREHCARRPSRTTFRRVSRRATAQLDGACVATATALSLALAHSYRHASETSAPGYTFGDGSIVLPVLSTRRSLGVKPNLFGDCAPDTPQLLACALISASWR